MWLTTDHTCKQGKGQGAVIAAGEPRTHVHVMPKVVVRSFAVVLQEAGDSLVQLDDWKVGNQIDRLSLPDSSSQSRSLEDW